MSYETADLLGLGQHCSVASCQQIDFLPFKCDCCSRIYCLEHRTYAKHACPLAGQKDCEVIVCPLCAKGVRLNGRDANTAFEQHTIEGGCDPRNWAKVNKKPKCPVKGCKEKLTTINTYHCKNCNQRVCLKHRHEDDHSCKEAKAAAQQERLQGSWLGRLQTAATSTMNSMKASSSSPALGGVAGGAAGIRATGTTSTSGAAGGRQQQRGKVEAVIDLTNTVKGTVDRRREQAERAALPESCPQCGARFASVERLIQHVEDFHPTSTTNPAHTPAGQRHQQQLQQPSSPGVLDTIGNWFSGTPSTATQQQQQQQQTSSRARDDGMTCPHCSTRFTDPVRLVEHAESCAARGRSQQQVASGKPAQQECSIQ